ncbi:hypothetical protein [Halorubrum ezzemoulense]|uniref:DUF8128 domain-containing protein n=1 Tax=Halorubrum ezzemoulense TaxID=337243 RepID=A0A256JZB0_HALEZ|nr:hypothetical protein [Halorubrum ezzemoulense]OYR74239.1 hypothetical protein DJ76_06945 [Halorubrum ezzemoulense]
MRRIHQPRIKSKLNLIQRILVNHHGYPAVQVDNDLYETLQSGLQTAEEDSGPRLRIRPPRENPAIDASINLYETIHDPHETGIGVGRFKLVSTSSHIHSHEMVYDGGKLQFFFKPDTRVDANQFERQLRKNYPDAQISEANKQFPTLDSGDHIAMAKMRLKQPFYYPIKCKIADEDFEVDPYGDITSDMVVEEDQTTDGQRVLAEDCRVMVQTIFEPARDVWTKRRPYGLNVTDAASKIKQGEVVGNMVEGYDLRDPGAKRSRTAKIIDKLHGAKGYYFTVRVLAISPHKEIAERRCNTVASDFEKYYNSFTEQGLDPIAIGPDEIPHHLREMAERTHSIPWSQRLKLGPGQPAVLQTVSALGSIAHIPNDSINTPVVDWAKQQTGPGIPAEAEQEDDVVERTTDTDEQRKSGFSPERAAGQTKTPRSTPVEPTSSKQPDESSSPSGSADATDTGVASSKEPETDAQSDGPDFRTPPQATPEESNPSDTGPVGSGESTATDPEPAGVGGLLDDSTDDEDDEDGEEDDDSAPWNTEANRRSGD